MKLDKVRKLRVGDIIVGSGGTHHEHLEKDSFWRVIAVEPAEYPGSLPVQVQRLGVNEYVKSWPFAHEISHRLPRVGEEVKVVGGAYCSIKPGDIRKVESIIFSDSGSPLIQLRNDSGNVLNFQSSWVERIKKPKVIRVGDTVKVIANSQGNPLGLHHIPIGNDCIVKQVHTGNLEGALWLEGISDGHNQTVLRKDVKLVKRGEVKNELSGSE